MMKRLVLALALLLACRGVAHALSGVASEITVQDGQIGIVDPLAMSKGGTGAALSVTAGGVVWTDSSSMQVSAAGTDNYVLHSTGTTAPDWGQIDLGGTNTSITGVVGIANGGTGANITASNGQVLYSGASVFALTTGGATGNCLKFNSGSAPTWGACSATTPALGFGTNMPVSAGTTLYANISGGVDQTEGIIQLPMSAATIANLRCVEDAVLGTGASHDIVITGRVGACGSLADGTLTCTITGAASGNQACNDTTNSIAPTAGQCVTFSIVAQSAISNAAAVNCSVQITG